MWQYQRVADAIKQQIAASIYQPGTRIPGTRQLAKSFNVSINTVLQAQKELEAQGLLESVPRSGFYVCEQNKQHAHSNEKQHLKVFKPALVKNQKLVTELISAAHQKGMVQLGAALPDESLLPAESLRLCLSRTARLAPELLLNYSFPPGAINLRKLLVKKMQHDGVSVNLDEIIITNGCHEAILLALKAITRPGDIVALESPCYYGLLQAIETSELKALEIPSTASEGIDEYALARACEQWPVKACILVSSYSNPSGGCAPTEKKQRLVNLLKQHKIPLIEDDVYGDLAFDGKRSPPMKAFDDSGEVIYCNSFSKTLAPGMRIGWIAAGSYAENISYLKFAQSLGVASLEQATLANFLRDNTYQKHCRQLQQKLSFLVHKSRELILQVFPSGTAVSIPTGGFVLWITLPKQVNSDLLYQQALEYNISIAPGSVFSSQPGQRYQHCFRINCAQVWGKRYQNAIHTLAELTHKQVNTASKL